MRDAAEPANRLERIRELLFGEQVRAHERRFEALEARLQHEVASIRDLVRERFETWEQNAAREADEVRHLLREQREMLADRLDGERDERREMLAEEQRRHEAALEALARNVQEVQEHRREQGDTLQTHLREQIGALEEQIGALEEQLAAAVDRARAHEEAIAARFTGLETSTTEALSKVDSRKPSRFDLAELFGELSGRLRSIPSQPSDEQPSDEQPSDERTSSEQQPPAL